MRNSLLISCLITAGILSACNSGGSSSDSGGDQPSQQWTNQIGAASNGGGRITYDPVKNMAYRDYESGGKVLCMVSESASASTPWDCNTLNNNLPSNISIGSTNVVTDNSGNVYAFGAGNNQSYLLKYDGSSWTSYPLTGAPTDGNSIGDSIFFYNGNFYAVSYSGSSGNVTTNLVGYNSSGSYVGSINNLYNGSSQLQYATSAIYNGRMYVTANNQVQSINLANPSDIQNFTAIPSPAGGMTIGLTVNSSGIVACNIYGIFSNSLNNGGWSNIGYTYSITQSGQTAYIGCMYAASKGNKALVVGYTPDSGSGVNAVYLQP